MSLCKSRVQVNCFTQVDLGLRQVIEELLGDRKIQVRPWRWAASFTIQRNRLLIARYRQIILVLVEVAETKVVVSSRHVGIQFDGLLKVPNRAFVIVSVVVQASEPI